MADSFDPQKSALLEKMAAIGVVWVFTMMTVCLMLPYFASYLKIDITEADRALVNNIVSAINNAFVWVLGFLYGQSVGSRQKDATIGTLASTASAVQAASGPAADKIVTVDAGETVAVSATSASSVPAKPTVK